MEQQWVRLVDEDEAGHVVSLVLDRPEARNAISVLLARQLGAATAELARRPGLRAVVLRSSRADAFCVGADLKERRGATTEDLLAARDTNRGAYGGVLGLPVPVVAAVTGYALGGGCELALSCDLVVGDAGTVLGLPEVGVGLLPGGGGTQLAVRRLGWGRAADLVLTARRVGGEEAYRLGLLDRLVADGTVVDEALDVARTVASRSPRAVRLAKQAMRDGAHRPLPDALDVEDAAWRQVVGGPDRVEGIAAFVEKREPRWADPA
ncbi:enoyl-CoA hydratase/isomerase family protein [Aquipuribacter nitratireducens]|uniref:Enoyl-CoA hydratase/isomerase family protein n=1 Tax=Aquipuribacter nitratireducens TaxID=650104 RepID=A0ABW0GKL9_9MICO